MSERWSDEETTIREVSERLAAFNSARDWDQYHAPKNLAMALAAEAGELLEPLLWCRADAPVDERTRAAVREELADVVISAVNLARRLDLDLMAAVEEKIAINARKYPVEASRGRATKHDRLGELEGDA